MGDFVKIIGFLNTMMFVTTVTGVAFLYVLFVTSQIPPQTIAEGTGEMTLELLKIESDKHAIAGRMVSEPRKHHNHSKCMPVRLSVNRSLASCATHG